MQSPNFPSSSFESDEISSSSLQMLELEQLDDARKIFEENYQHVNRYTDQYLNVTDFDGPQSVSTINLKEVLDETDPKKPCVQHFFNGHHSH